MPRTAATCGQREQPNLFLMLLQLFLTGFRGLFLFHHLLRRFLAGPLSHFVLMQMQSKVAQNSFHVSYVYCCSTCTSLQLLCCIHIFVFSFIYRCNIAVILSSKSHFPMSYVCVCLCLLE